jgi:ABC-2 type transport system permease protein
MLRYLRLSAALFRYSFIREMMFKVNFVTWIVVEIAWFGLQLALVEVLFAHTQSIAGWTKFEMILLVGTSHLIQQVFQLLFMVNLIDLPENVRTGRLDFFLLQPASPQFLVTVRKFDVGSIANAGIGLAFVVYAAVRLGLHPSLFQVGLYSALVINGILIHYALMLIIVSLSFWIVRAQGLVYGYYNLFQITRIPRDAFKGMIKVVFTFAVPMLVVANFPTEVLVRQVWGWGMFDVLGLTVALMLLSTAWFRFALRAYTSASS